MHTIVQGDLEAIDQLAEFIVGLNDEDYNYSHGTVLSSTVGQHLRHILDLYLALINRNQGVADYDNRRRGAAVENCRQVGLQEIASVRQWLTELTDVQIASECVIQTEVMHSRCTSIQTASSLGRELCFVSSHLTHHLAIMAALAKLAGCSVSDSVGVAPATASYIRSLPENSPY